MSHGHALVQQSLVVNDVALGTLGSRTAIALNATMGSLTQGFLLKRYRYLLQIAGKTVGDDGPIVVLMNKGDATLAEINSAMIENNTAGMDDTTQVLTQDEAWTVYQNTVNAFVLTGDGTEGTMVSEWKPFGGKNGIPALEGQGFAVHAFNCGSGALTTGATVNGLVQVQGVWLRD